MRWCDVFETLVGMAIFAALGFVAYAVYLAFQ